MLIELTNDEALVIRKALNGRAIFLLERATQQARYPRELETVRQLEKRFNPNADTVQVAPKGRWAP